MSTNEVVGSGFQPYKASSLSEASKLMPPPPPSPYAPPAYGYPSTLFSGSPLHAYRYDIWIFSFRPIHNLIQLGNFSYFTYLIFVL